MSNAYDAYKKAMDTNMKPFEELTDKEKNAWASVELHYTTKPEITESATYELYKSKNKDAKEFNELPDGIKRMWANLDKNYDKIVKSKEQPKPKEKPQPKAKQQAKGKQPQKDKKPRKQKALPKTTNQMVNCQNVC